MKSLYTPYAVTISDHAAGPPSSPSAGDIWYATNYCGTGTRQQFQYNASGGTWDLVGTMALLYDSQAAGVTFATSSITTPSLPQTFKNLRVEWRAVSTAGGLDQLTIRFNGDSSAHYYYTSVYNQNGTISGGTTGGTLATYISCGWVTQSSGFPGGGTFDVMDYASTQYKPLTGNSHAENTAVPTWITGSHGGQYNQSTPGISTITFGLFASAASFQSGRFMVYGIN